MKLKFGRVRRHYYSTKEVSDIFGVNESTIKRWSDSGRLKCIKTLGGHRKYAADWILDFIETFKFDVETTPAEFTHETEKRGGNMNDFLLLKEDYHTMREICFADSLKADIESLTNLLMHCRLKAEIPATVIFEEIVLKTIEKIKSLCRQQKLNREQEKGAINAVLESFARLNRFLHS